MSSSGQNALATEEPLNGSKRYKLLVVDDSAMFQNIATSNLQALGHEVLSADGGRAALALLARHSFDLVFLDVEMPDMNGIETLQRLRRLRPTLKVVMLTSHDDEGTFDAAMTLDQHGADGFVTKPYSKDTLERCIDAVLVRGGRFVS